VYPIVVLEYEPPIAEMVVVTPRGTKIQLNMGLTHTEKRRRIAHDLAHLLLSAYAVSDSPDFYTFKKEAVTEEACGAFEKRLCDLHDSFYRNPSNWEKLFFEPPFDPHPPAP